MAGMLLVATVRQRTLAQREAFRRFAPVYQRITPDPRLDAALVGKHLFYPALDLVMEYRYSFTGIDGALYCAGIVVYHGAGIGIRVGLS